jgi:hypothetical protein
MHHHKQKKPNREDQQPDDEYSKSCNCNYYQNDEQGGEATN